ncbi:MAG TPA: hypothetical protein VGH58_12055 [Solirubrobacterales bacterium]
METVLAGLGVSAATTLSWLPDKLDVANAMVIGAGVGAAVGGGLGLLPFVKAKATKLSAAGTVVFLALATLVVVIEILFGDHGRHPFLFP